MATSTGRPLAVRTTAACCSSSPRAAPFTVLHDFNSTIDGSGPNTLVQASDGRFFGTTTAGGPAASRGASGTLYSITSAGQVTVLHVFISNVDPRPSALIVGNDGNFYGTTSGDLPATNDPFDDGDPATLFQVTPAGVFTTVSTIPLTGRVA